MKTRLFLTTSFLTCAALFVPLSGYSMEQNMHGQDLKSRVEVYGKTDFRYAHTNNSKGHDSEHKEDSFIMAYDFNAFSEVWVNENVKVGAKVLLRSGTDFQKSYSILEMPQNAIAAGVPASDTSILMKGSTVSIDNAMVYVDTKYGSFMAGLTVDEGPYKMIIDASTISAGSGGISGGTDNFINLKGDTLSKDAAGNSFANSTRIKSRPEAYLVEQRSNAPRVIYMTPDMEGLQVGFGFVLDSGDGGKYIPLTSEEKGEHYKDVVIGGASYSSMINDELDLKISAVGEYGTHEEYCNAADFCASNYFDLETIKLGAQVGYSNFTFAASYSNYFKTGIKKNPAATTDPTQYTVAARTGDGGTGGPTGVTLNTVTSPEDYRTHDWTAGMAYSTDKSKFSFSYYNNKTGQGDIAGGQAEYTKLVVGADYSLIKNFLVYAEISHFKVEDETYSTLSAASATAAENAGRYALGSVPTDNSGYVVMLGAKASF